MAEALSTPAPVPAPLPVRRPRRLLRRVGIGLAVLLSVLLLAVLAGGFWFRSRMEASLPQLAGEAAVPGLAAAVEVERDALGVPTIRAASREDAARALGFLHAQDRFFQMDLLRRSAAGELAEVVGSAAVEGDREVRIHRFRHVAGRVVAQAPPEERAFLQSYSEGVNAGLSALGDKPFEYLLLGVEPAPWRPEDSILAVFAMFIDLQDEDGSRESELGFLHDTLPREMFHFLALPGTEWDAPLEGGAFAVPPVPGPEVFDLRKAGAARSLPKVARVPSAEPAWNEFVPGSNNWAVAGTHTAHGGALLANDMHLGIRVPNTWYRASIVRPDSAGGTLRLTGVTLPGAPSIVVGSNGHVAWGFTNSYGDWSDVVLLEVDPRQPGTYRTPAGLKAFRTVKETIRVKGDEPVLLEVKETIWGPVIGTDHRGRQRAFAWTAHRPQAVNLGIQGMESARTLEEAMAVAHRSGIPAQNCVLADAAGRIGWTLMGRIPRRVGFTGRIPTSWADGSRRWDGWLAPGEVPRVIDPPSGRIWTANARVVGGEALEKLGDGGYDLGARSRQIRDGLFALGSATPRDMLAVQLDDRALFLERWRKLLLDTLTPEAVTADPRRSELRRLVETTWTGRASVDSVAYRMVRAFRLNLAHQVFTSLTGQGQRPEGGRFGPTRQFEGWLWRLVSERPVHLLDPRFESWDEQLLAAVDETLGYFADGGELAGRTWGERNTTSFAHPLSAAVPFLGRWLDVPAKALPGDENMPRFQSASEGASERMIVSPGAEEAGFFHMPVGQSGHPLSPYYLAGHEAWERGEPAPFLPGPAEHRLRLVPR